MTSRLIREKVTRTGCPPGIIDATSLATVDPLLDTVSPSTSNARPPSSPGRAAVTRCNQTTRSARMLPVLIDDDAAGLKHGVDGPQSVASSKTLNSELPVSTMTFRVWFGVPSSRAMRKCRPSSERVNGIVTSAVDTACVNATQRTVPLQCMSEVYAAPAAIPDSWHADTCIVTGWQWHPTTYLQHRLCETTTLLLPHSAGSADCPVPSTINQVVSPRDARN